MLNEQVFLEEKVPGERKEKVTTFPCKPHSENLLLIYTGTSLVTETCQGKLAHVEVASGLHLGLSGVCMSIGHP